MSRNRVIGVNGRIPWKLPDDRQYYKELTRGCVLILGRQTFHENLKLAHIAHASHAVVLSRTLQDSDLPRLTSTSNRELTSITIARSFPEALNVARQLVHKSKKGSTNMNINTASRNLDCWVVGGEGVYHEALLHPSADQLHLTVVEIDVEDHKGGDVESVAHFPAKYRWDNKFQLVSSEAKTDPTSDLWYRIDVFRRLKGRR